MARLGELPTPIDVLARSPRAAALADRFRIGLGKSEYGAHHLRGIGPIPRHVLVDYAEAMCLCGLGQSADEQSLLRSALLGKWDDLPLGETEQRRRSFAYTLHLLDRVPHIAASESAMRDEIWKSFEDERGNETIVARASSQWAALIAKDVMQDALSSIWNDLCALGLARQSSDGLTPRELDEMLATELPGRAPLDAFGQSIAYDATTQTRDFADAVVTATQSQSLESVRRWANGKATAIAGLALLLVLYERLEDVDAPPGWAEIAGQHSERQPSVHQLGVDLAEHMKSDPSLAESLSSIARRSIIAAHEVIAYSKLPDFTFRFRWENGRLRFYPHDRGRFEVTDIRRDSTLSGIRRRALQRLLRRDCPDVTGDQAARVEAKRIGLAPIPVLAVEVDHLTVHQSQILAVVSGVRDCGRADRMTVRSIFRVFSAPWSTMPNSVQDGDNASADRGRSPGSSPRSTKTVAVRDRPADPHTLPEPHRR